MDRFAAIQAFVAVVEAGSFVRGAAAVGQSKAGISRYVAELEAQLGVRLLNRTTRNLSLTEEGGVFHERCKELLAQLAEAEAEISAHSGSAIGQLRINAPVTFGLQYLAALWPEFMAQHPRVSLEVTLGDRFIDLVDEGYDLAVRIARLPTSSLISRKLASTRMLLCASPTYLRERGTPLHPDELSAHDVVSYSLLSMGESWELDGPEGPVVARVNARFRTNSGETCCAAAVGHQGIIMQPSFLVAPALHSGELVEVLPEYRAVELGIYAVYPSRRHVTAKVRLMIDFLVAAFRTKAWPQ